MSSTNLKIAYNRFFIDQPGLGGPAVWPYDQEIKIGDYGNWNDGRFYPAGNIANLRDAQSNPLSFAVSEVIPVSDMSARSSHMNATDTYFNAQGAVVSGTDKAAVSASVKYSSSEANSFVVKMANVTTQAMMEVESVLAQVAKAFDHNPGITWNPSDRIITQLWTAGRYFMFGTASSTSSMTVKGSVSVITDFIGGNVDSGLSTVQANDGSLEVPPSADGTPVFVMMTLAAIDHLSPFRFRLGVTR